MVLVLVLVLILIPFWNEPHGRKRTVVADHRISGKMGKLALAAEWRV